MRAIIDARVGWNFFQEIKNWESNWNWKLCRKSAILPSRAKLREARNSTLMTRIRGRLCGKRRIDRNDHRCAQVWLACVSRGILINADSGSLINARCREHIKLPGTGRQKEQSADSRWPCVSYSNVEFNVRRGCNRVGRRSKWNEKGRKKSEKKGALNVDVEGAEERKEIRREEIGDEALAVTLQREARWVRYYRRHNL